MNDCVHQGNRIAPRFPITCTLVYQPCPTSVTAAGLRPSQRSSHANHIPASVSIAKGPRAQRSTGLDDCRPGGSSNHQNTVSDSHWFYSLTSLLSGCHPRPTHPRLRFLTHVVGDSLGVYPTWNSSPRLHHAGSTLPMSQPSSCCLGPIPNPAHPCSSPPLPTPAGGRQHGAVHHPHPGSPPCCALSPPWDSAHLRTATISGLTCTLTRVCPFECFMQNASCREHMVLKYPLPIPHSVMAR